jgi:hypothetical protein
MSATAIGAKSISRLRNFCFDCSDVAIPFTGNQTVVLDNTNIIGGGGGGFRGGDFDELTVETLNATNIFSTNITNQVINSDVGNIPFLYTQFIGGIEGSNSGIIQIGSTVDFDNQIMIDVNVSSGKINGTVIGFDDPSNGYFEDLTTYGNVNLLGASGEDCVSWNPDEGLFTICGNLLVQGESTVIESESVVITDRIITLSSGTTYTENDNKDRGIEFDWHDDTQTRLGFMGFDNDNERFTFYKYAQETDEVYSGTLGDIITDTMYLGNLSGITTAINIASGTTINFGNHLLYQDTLTDDLIFGSTGQTIKFYADDIQFPEVVEQQWISYRDFDVIGTTGSVPASIPITERDEVSSIPYYSWNFCVESNGQFYIHYDITQGIRDAINKGFQLTSIFPSYSVETSDLVSIEARVFKYETSSGGKSGVELTVDNTNFETTIGTKYPQITVTSDYLSAHENVMIELVVHKNTNTVFKFNGITVEYYKKLI